MADYCHPTHSQRTKCLCGAVISLGGAYGDTVAVCACGRVHKKAPGSSFERGYLSGLSTGKRLGGKDGCPGIRKKP